MILKDATITKGFVIAGLMNLSVLIFSKLFTNETIAEFDPVVLSNFGLIMIVIWGLAYISVAKNFSSVKWIVAVFAIEKFVYGCVWINWILNNSVSDVFAEDFLAGLFYSIYGVNDWLFFIFFSLVFIHLIRIKKDNF